ncbi:MAG TPA: hypothetical protein VF950_25910 [Planctomycetota bacterium]
MSDERRVPAWLKILVGLGVLAALTLVAGWALRIEDHFTTIRVLNASGVALEEAAVDVRYSGNAPAPHRAWTGDSWAAGHEIAFYPRAFDIDVAVSWVKGGVTRKLETHVDVWRGETFLIEILPDFTLKGSYVPRSAAP